MRNIIFFLTICTLFLASCNGNFFDQTVTIDPPAYEKKIAAHLFGSNTDEELQIMLSRNFGIFENVKEEEYFIKNAVIELWEEGQKKLALSSGLVGQNDRFTVVHDLNGVSFFQPDKNYELRVSHPDYPGISGKQRMPSPVKVDSVNYSTRRSGQFGDITLSVNVYLKDPAGVKNYYEVLAEVESIQLFPVFDNMNNFIRYDTILSYNELYDIDSDDPNVVETRNRGLAVSDDVFDGNSYKFVYKGNPSYFNSNNLKYKVRVWVRAITQEYYQFAITSKRSEDSGDNPFAEPVRIFSNMENGIGAFTLCHEQLFEIQ
jgi:hypothetical protein